MSQKNSNSKKNIIIILAVLFVIVIVALSLLSNILSQEDTSKSNANSDENNEIIEEENNESIIKELQGMEERERMEYYFGVFLDYVENEEYEKAYKLLNSSFKENYFPTIEEFKEYCKKTFSDMMDIEHTNIERNGELYVLWVSITDAINGKKDDSKEINVVIKENDYYDFEMSFSVI